MRTWTKRIAALIVLGLVILIAAMGAKHNCSEQPQPTKPPTPEIVELETNLVENAEEFLADTRELLDTFNELKTLDTQP